MAEAHPWEGRTIVDRNGDRLARIRAVYLDDQTDRPKWATVKTGLLSGDRCLPLTGASADTPDIHVRATRAQIRSAPSVDPGGVLAEHDEAQLDEHYRAPEE